MEVIVNDKPYKVEIIRKNNKNLYIRVKDDLTIYVTTNYLTTNKEIERVIRENYSSLTRMILKAEKRHEKQEKFILLGSEYSVVIANFVKEPEIIGDQIFASTKQSLNKFLRCEAQRVFLERFDYCLSKFERVKRPTLRIRKMKGKWGHYNRLDHVVTLNSELIKYSISEIDYVIIHELCHIIHFNHSKDFWDLVSIYKPDYKSNRKVLRDE